MSAITTHVLDTARGTPGVAIPVTLGRWLDDGEWQQVAQRETDASGRITDFLDSNLPVSPGTYRLRFDIDRYLDGGGFFPVADVVFKVADAAGHYHVPLLLSPFGYSTYRGT